VVYAISTLLLGVLQVVGERHEIEAMNGVVMQGYRMYRVGVNCLRRDL
jgi:hypothetical protein